MMDESKKEYLVACMQLNTIFNIMPKDIRNKIPQEYIKEIKRHKLKNYSFKYDYNKSLNEQSINSITREVLVNIYREYLCEKEEQEQYDEKLEILEKSIRNSNESQRNNNSNDDIFKKALQKKENNDSKLKEEASLIKTKEEKWYKKIFLLLRNIFNK